MGKTYRHQPSYQDGDSYSRKQKKKSKHDHPTNNRKSFQKKIAHLEDNDVLPEINKKYYDKVK